MSDQNRIKGMKGVLSRRLINLNEINGGLELGLKYASKTPFIKFGNLRSKLYEHLVSSHIIVMHEIVEIENKLKECEEKDAL